MSVSRDVLLGRVGVIRHGRVFCCEVCLDSVALWCTTMLGLSGVMVDRLSGELPAVSYTRGVGVCRRPCRISVATRLAVHGL